MDSAEIVGFGAPIVDHIIEIDDHYLNEISGVKGGMVVVDFPTFQKILTDCAAEPNMMLPGGSAANTIKGLGYLGHSCAFIGKIGQDAAGKKFVDEMVLCGVETRFLIKSSAPTSQVACLVTPDKERTMRTFLGASKEIKPDDLQNAMFSNAKLTHFEGYNLLNLPLLMRAIEMAKAAKAKISMDLGCLELIDAHRDLVIDILTRHVDIVFANEREVWSLTKLNPEKGCALLRDICDTVVVFAGKRGCFIGQQSQLIYHPAFVVENPVDTTAAGDLFASGFLHGYLRGKPLTECGRLGALAGAAAVKVQGGNLSSKTWTAFNS